MSRIIRHIFLIVGFLFLAAAGLVSPRACAATFTSSLDRDTIALGEQATLSLTFGDGQPKNVPTPDVPGLQIIQTGNQTGFSFVNGAMSSTFTVTFSVTPQRAGEFTIPAMKVDVGGQMLASQPLKLTVANPGATVAGGASPDSQFAFAKLTLPQKQVYAGQIVIADLQLFYRQDTQLANQPQITATPAEGFTVGKIVGGAQTLTRVGNAIYNVIPAKIALTASKTGTLHFGPITIGIDLLVPSNDRRPDPFDPFGMMRRSAEKPLSIATEALDVKSLPLPSENVPPGFNGAIGDFTMTASVGPTNLTVGDPVTVHVQISGRGALGAVQLPDQTALRNFKVFPPTSKTETSDQLGLEGTKTFEEIVTPQNSDVQEWPQFSFSFFNPDDAQYHTLAEPAVPLAVKAAGASPMPTIAAAKNSAPENQTPQDILPIKENLGTLAKNSAPLISQPAFVALQTLPIFAFIGAFIWRKRTDSLANNPRLRRKIAVEKLVQTGIADLKNFAAQNNPEEFFALLFRLLQEQLGERLDCPATAITENVVEENSILRGANETTRADLRELFQLCNQARYAPVRGTSELNSVAAQFEKVIGELQEVKP